MNFYNEIDPYAAQWLRSLIAAGDIPAGVVDERSIEDIAPNELRQYTQCHFFAGIAGWSHALALAGWDASQPCWTGSAPCQPFSAAGKGAGFTDERDLWPTWLYLVAQCRPSVIFGEQVASAIGHGWLDRAVSDLEGNGYAVGSAVLQASGADALHKRDRLWFVADAKWDKQPRKESRSGSPGRVGRVEQPVSPGSDVRSDWFSTLSRLRALDNGLPRNVAGTDAARNAIVPQIGAEFVMAYMEAV